MTTKRLKLTVVPREETGKEAARRLRKQGLVPGVVYGAGVKPINIGVSEEHLRELLLHQGRSRMLREIYEVTVEGKSKPFIAVMKELRSDPLTRKLLNVDLQRVKAGQKIRVEIPVNLVGECAAVRDEGAILEQVAHQIMIEAPIDSIPDGVEVDVTDLKIGDSVSIGDLTLPEGVEPVSSLDETVVAVAAPRVEVVEEAEEEEGEEGEEAEGEGEEAEESESED